MKKVRFGLVGCGRISENHIRAFTDHRHECELVAVCDIVPERARAAAAAASEAGGHAVTPYTDYAEMLKVETLDAVSICTPSGLHTEHGIQAADTGRHVVTEKPMAITLESCDRLIQACDRNRVQLLVVKQNRMNTTLQLLKRAVDKGRFGRIYGAYVNVFWQRPQNYYDQAKWRGTWEFDGGAFMNQASHYVDALHWLVGEVESVMAFTGTLARRIEAEDSGSAVFRFRNGAIGSMNVSMLAYPKNMEGSVTIIGEKGTVKLGGIAVNKFEKWEFAEYDDDDKLVMESNYEPPNVYGFGHTAYYKNVLDVLRGRGEANTDWRSGRKSLELILAIYKSARDHQQVALPLQG